MHGEERRGDPGTGDAEALEGLPGQHHRDGVEEDIRDVITAPRGAVGIVRVALEELDVPERGHLPQMILQPERPGGQREVIGRLRLKPERPPTGGAVDLRVRGEQLIIIPDEAGVEDRDKDQDRQYEEEETKEEVLHKFLLAIACADGRRRSDGFLGGCRSVAARGPADFACHLDEGDFWG